ncbi:MAG: hypothetical protein JOZ69_24720 [Myxococcales bacterium]|nr:hypothetical protein [Myxococcales bacterium]
MNPLCPKEMREALTGAFAAQDWKKFCEVSDLLRNAAVRPISVERAEELREVMQESLRQLRGLDASSVGAIGQRGAELLRTFIVSTLGSVKEAKALIDSVRHIVTKVGSAHTALLVGVLALVVGGASRFWRRRPPPSLESDLADAERELRDAIRKMYEEAQLQRIRQDRKSAEENLAALAKELGLDDERATEHRSEPPTPPASPITTTSTVGSPSLVQDDELQKRTAQA